jgi:small-conductance mechanosensitive channel
MILTIATFLFSAVRVTATVTMTVMLGYFVCKIMQWNLSLAATTLETADGITARISMTLTLGSHGSQQVHGIVPIPTIVVIGTIQNLLQSILPVSKMI